MAEVLKTVGLTEETIGEMQSMKRMFTVAAAAVVLSAVGAVDAHALTRCSPTNGWSVVRVNAHTTCAFARNIARKIRVGRYGSPIRVRAYSPVTNRMYVVSCRGSRYQRTCTGRNQIFIRLID